MTHTFLLQPGFWLVKGTYFDNSNNPTPMEAQTRITHHDHIWINEGSMKLLLPETVEFQNRYEVTPLKPGQDFTAWKSFMPLAAFWTSL